MGLYRDNGKQKATIQGLGVLGIRVFLNAEAWNSGLHTQPKPVKTSSVKLVLIQLLADSRAWGM